MIRSRLGPRSCRAVGRQSRFKGERRGPSLVPSWMEIKSLLERRIMADIAAEMTLAGDDARGILDDALKYRIALLHAPDPAQMDQDLTAKAHELLAAGVPQGHG